MRNRCQVEFMIFQRKRKSGSISWVSPFEIISRQEVDFSRLGRGTKPKIIAEALPNLPKTRLSVQALANG